MLDKDREGFYASELKDAIHQYLKTEEEARKALKEKKKHEKLVKSLVSVLAFNHGVKDLRELLAREELLEMAEPFLESDSPPKPLAGTVVRRRKGKKRIVDPENVLAKGTFVRMTAGKYTGYTGQIASTQVRKTARGRDVTYFLTVSRGRSGAKRTSVKHGSLNKSWQVA